jgi:hypothetical protein
MFGKSYMNKILCMWFKHFQKGNEDLNECSDKVKKIIMDNCRITNREISDDAGLTYMVL